jgi:hypothetical protein
VALVVSREDPFWVEPEGVKSVRRAWRTVVRPFRPGPVPEASTSGGWC